MKIQTLRTLTWRWTQISFCLGISACMHGTTPIESADIYLLMGQSNMSGRGLLADLTPANQSLDRGITLYGNDGVWRLASEPLDSATNQIDPVSADAFPGVGPGLFFARAMRAARPGRPIVLVPCAKGGTAITLWMRSDARSSLYGSCLARAREARSRGHLAGILWYQGESDADTQTDADAWAGRFTDMVTAFRADVGQPTLPIVLVGLGDRPMSGPYAQRFVAWTTVQAAQSRLQLADHDYISAVGLPRNDDLLHISTTGQAVLGQRLAVAMNRLRADTHTELSGGAGTYERVQRRTFRLGSVDACSG